jgi:TonB family protein
MILLPLLALVAAPPPPAPPPPPIVTVGGDIATAVLSFRAGRARCQSGEEMLVRDEPPLPQITSGAPDLPAPAPVMLRFRIDATGRPLSIVEETRSGFGPYYDSRDVAAALAASRFREGQERSGCTIAFEVRAEPVEQADLATLYRLVALQPPPAFSARRLIFERVTPPGSTCFNDPRLNVRLRAYPAFEEIAQPSGTFSYSFLGFDLDAKGRPRNVRLLGSGGNAELDRQSLDAVRRSRFSPIAKRGCTYSYWRRQTEPLTPPEPPPDAYRADEALCPKDGSPWDYMPPLSFPPEFERRGIEGWAILRFDIAPWGGVGNVSVLAAEPSSAFGQQAMQIVSGARKPASSRGYTGCVTRVLFRMAASREAGTILAP